MASAAISGIVGGEPDKESEPLYVADVPLDGVIGRPTCGYHHYYVG